ncbi:MAG: hypothetical protein O2856_14460, partial [Planctomycetota bacterium]|nr:hypothetical protein [Planctomycetota bacterium]
MHHRIVTLALYLAAFSQPWPVAADEPTRLEWKYQADLLRPFWQGTVMQGESVLFIKDEATGESRASVLFPILEMPMVQDSTGAVTYEEGRDFVWKRGTREITLPPNSRIPS